VRHLPNWVPVQIGQREGETVTVAELRDILADMPDTATVLVGRLDMTDPHPLTHPTPEEQPMSSTTPDSQEGS